MAEKDISKMTDAELRANAAAIKKNQELIKQINANRRNFGGAGGGIFGIKNR